MSKSWDWNSRRAWCLGGLVLVAIAIFIRPLAIVVGQSIHVDEYSQILVVTPLALSLLYLDRRNLLREISYNRIGVALYVAFVIIFLSIPSIVSDASTRLSISLMLFASTCISAFLLCYGSRAVRVGAFPLSFLVLMAPLPDALREHVITFLQQGSAVVTDWFFTLAQIPFTREGVVIALPTVTIEIAQECSGIRSSMVMLFSGLVLAHLFLRSKWSKIALFFLMVPLTIVKNGIRIFALSTLGMYVDPSFLTGKLHHNGGIVFFALAFAMLWAMVWILQKLEDRLLRPGSSPQTATVRSA